MVNVKSDCRCNGTGSCAICGGTGEFKKGVSCRSCGGGGRCVCRIRQAERKILKDQECGGETAKIGDLVKAVIANIRPSQ